MPLIHEQRNSLKKLKQEIQHSPSKSLFYAFNQEYTNLIKGAEDNY
jgi:hypothetical protein